MYKTGIVKNIDEKLARVRVMFPDMDNMLSGWLVVIFPFTKRDKKYGMPSIDEQVACIMDENFEDGCVFGSPYSEEDKPPTGDKNKFYTEFEDGTRIEYDKKAHKLLLDIKGTLDLKATTILINGTNFIDLWNTHTHPEPDGGTGAPNQRLN